MSPWRKTFYAAWMGQVCSITGFFFIMPLLPLYIADRYGRKPMVLRSMIGGVVVLVLMAHARDVNDLFLCRVLQGCLTGTITASVALVASVTPDRHSERALGMMSAAMFCGAAVGPVMGGFIAERYGFYATFWAAASVVLLGAILVAVFTEEEFTPQPRTDEGRLASLRQIFAASGFLAALFVLFQMRFSNYLQRPVFALFVKDLHGQEAGAKAWTGCIAGFASAAGAVSAGLLFGHMVRRWGHKRLLIYSTLAAGVLSLPVMMVDYVWQFMVLRVLFGFVFAATIPCANVIVRRIIREKHLGKAFGITSSVQCLGSGTGPLVGGFVGAAAGLRAPFLLAGVLLICSAIAVAWLLKVAAGPAPNQ